MNKIKVCLVSICMALSFSISYAQDYVDNSVKNALKVSPAQFGKSYFEISYEQMLKGGKSSIQISPMIMLKKSNFEEFSGIQGEIQYRSYVKKLNKYNNSTWFFSNIDFYAGGYASGMAFTAEEMRYAYDEMTNMSIEEVVEQKITSYEGGVFVGSKFILTDRIIIDFLVGGGVRYSDVDDPFADMYPNSYSPRTDGVFDIGYYGIKPRVNLQVGITL